MSSYEASVMTNLTNFIPGSLDSLNNPERHVKVNCNLCGLFVKCGCVVYNVTTSLHYLHNVKQSYQIMNHF